MKPLVDSVPFFNSAILAKFRIVSLRHRSIDYPPTLHVLRTKCSSPCEMLHKRNFMHA